MDMDIHTDSLGIILLSVDKHLNLSIENTERNKKSRGQLFLKKIVTSVVIEQWRSFLPCNKDKNPLLTFDLHECRKIQCLSKIGDKYSF